MKVGIITFEGNKLISVNTATARCRENVVDLEFTANDRHISPPIDSIPADLMPRTVNDVKVIKRLGKTQDVIIWLPENDTT